ncbi:MAG: hypothetical protein FDZ72_15245 [Betaproteobacteria bacterium]|nr:MAG: hypothetical protein FDZ72_15245 [Betaproteobacteria bacterium]
MFSILKTALSKIKLLFSIFWQFFTGIVVAIVAFAANFQDFKQPDVSVEITAVTSTSSEPIDLVRIPELSGLKAMVEGDGLLFRFSIRNSGVGMTPDEIDRQLLILNGQVSSQALEFDRIERRFTSIAANRTPDQETLLNDLVMEFAEPFRFANPSEVKKSASAQDRVDGLINEAKKLISEKRNQQSDFAAKVKEAERQWSNYKTNMLPNKARLVVTSAIGNRGAGATSLKPQALFRANLGDGNYLDFPMKLSGYEKSVDSSSFQTQVFKVLRFESDEVQSMAPADRERFKSFLGNASPATLFVSDVRGNTYSSNTVPFSPGVYEQKVYDSLKQFASRSLQR